MTGAVNGHIVQQKQVLVGVASAHMKPAKTVSARVDARLQGCLTE